MPTVKSHQGSSSRISDRYDGSPKRFHSVLRRLFQYVLRKRLYFWRGRVMTMKNCPNKLRLILTDQIKYKWILDELLKKKAVYKAFKIEKETNLTIPISDICTYFTNNPTRSEEQREKLIQIIHDFREVLPQIYRRECFGFQSFDKVVVEYLNKQYENIQGENRFSETIDEDVNVEKLLQPYEKGILSREEAKNEEYQSENTEQEIKQIFEQEKRFLYQFHSYRQDEDFKQFQCQPRHELTQSQRINFMRKFRFHLQDYLWNFDQSNPFQKKDKHKFSPINITTKILKRQQKERIERLRMEEQENQGVSCSLFDKQEGEARSGVMVKRVKLMMKQRSKQQQQLNKKDTNKPYQFPKPIRNLLKQADDNWHQHTPILSPDIPHIPYFYKQEHNQDELYHQFSNQEFSSNSLFSINRLKKPQREEATSNGRSQNISTGNRNVRHSFCMGLPGDVQAQLYY